MAAAAVHFAVGMGVAAAAGVAVGAVRRRWLIGLPLAMTLCGVLALVPDLLAAGVGFMPTVGSRAWSHGPWMNVCFLHPLLDGVAWLDTREMASLGFQVVALLYLVVVGADAAFIRWWIPRMRESGEALARLEGEAPATRSLVVLVGLVPLLVLGGALGWLTRTAPAPGRLGERQARARWSRLVRRRMGVTPGERLGLVAGVPWSDGEWLVGDVCARSRLSGGSATVAEVVERAQAHRCQFVVLADGAGLTTGERAAAHAAALAAARAKFRDTAVLGGLAWRDGLVVVAPQAGESALLAGLRDRLEGPPAEALRWVGAHSRAGVPAPVAFGRAVGRRGVGSAELFAWLRSGAGFVGIVGLPSSARGGAPGVWDPRVAEVGGTWDRLLDRGFQVWGAAAGSGFGDPGSEHWPGEQVRTHVWCRGRGAAAVVEGLRAGCFWADEGGMVESLRFELLAPLLGRAARMGEVAWVAPGAATSVELTLELPQADLAGRAGRVDEVELVSNVGGEPSVVQRFRGVESGRLLRLALPPAEDRNGGVGFYVRARGFRRLADGGAEWFYTNPIRVLVHPGASPAAEPPPQLVARPVRPSTAGAVVVKPRTSAAAKPIKPDTATALVAKPADPLDKIGLPREVHVVQMETFARKPGRHWRGAWTTNVAERGPAIGDEDLRVSYVREVGLGEATRLFFRCHARRCGRLRVLLHTSRSGKPYERVFALEDGKWMAFDLSLRGDFHPPLGAPGRLGPADPVLETEGDDVRAIEWRAEDVEPAAGFFIGDFVIYERTRTARVAFARRRAGEPGPAGPERRSGTLERALLEVAAEGQPSAAWQGRAAAVARRLAACRARLYGGPKLAVFRELGALEQELDALAEEIRLLRLQSRMARAFGLDEPRFAVGVTGPGRRVSWRNGALAFEGPAGRRHSLSAAAGEAESFQLVVQALWERLHAVEVTWTGFAARGGARAGLPASAVSASVAGELWVAPRVDLPRERDGWMPGPLGPLLPFDVAPGRLRSVLLTVRVPPDLPPGDYRATATVRPLGMEPATVEVLLHRWDFALVGSHLPIVGPVDERALREEYGLERGVPQALRRQLYEVLLGHRVSPVPLMVADEAAALADLEFCLERGMALAVVHRAASAQALDGTAIERAGRYAARLREAGWGSPCAVLLPLLRESRGRAALAAASKAFRARYPAVRLIAGGHGESPAGTAADYWRRPLGVDELRRPSADAVEVRRTRSTRVEAWELGSQSPDYPDANLTLANALGESRALAWLAWRHGVRALVLGGVNDWRDGERGRGVLVYPGPAGEVLGSLRLVALRDGAEDYEYLWLLWDRARRLRERAPQRHLGVLATVDHLLADVAGRVGTMGHPAAEPEVLAALRQRLGRLVERLEAAWWEEVDASGDLPKAPPRLAAAAGDGRVTLSWPKSPDDEVAGYHVYRSCEPKVGFVRITAVPAEALTYTDSPVRNDETYYYFVRSCVGEAEGPRSAVADATPKPAPKVVWGAMGDLTANTVGPYRVVLSLEGPGVGGVLPLVRPQIDYCLSDGFYDGFEEMTRSADRAWGFGVPDLGWRRQGSKTLRYKVRIVDRQSRVVTPAVERAEAIDTATGREAPAP